MNKFNLGKVRGEDGKSATIAIGTVRTGQAGSDARVENVGDSLRAILDFTIPRGDKGEKGDRGNEAYYAGSNVQISGGVISATDTTYAPATPSADGLMSKEDKVKLSGIATEATKNDTDAQLRDRATHTGTQAISTVAGLQGELDDRVLNNDSRLTDSREWIATTASQEEAEAGTATTRRAWTAQRVRQAIAAWWNGATSKLGRTLVGRNTAAEMRGDLGLDNVDNTSDANKPVSAAQQAVFDAKVDKAVGMGLSSNDFTSTLKDKLVGLEGSHWRGTFVSLAALQAGVTDPATGDYADVDAVGADVERYIWDATDSVWVVQSGAVAPITASQVKQLYESNADTNAFTDADEAKLDGIQSGAQVNTVTSVNSRIGAVTGLVENTDSRLSDAREWTATTVSQEAAEAGTSSIRRAWTAQRVRQAIAAWWDTAADKVKLNGIATEATKNATNAQLRDRTTHTGEQAISTVSGLQGELDDRVLNNDSRLTDSREWIATTASQEEAEAGTATTRRAWTAQRVRQAIAAWWGTIGTAFGKTLLGSADASAARQNLGLGTAATRDVTTSNTDTTVGRLLKVGDFGLGTVGRMADIPVTDLDDLIINGVFNVSHNAPNWAFPGVGGVVQEFMHGPNQYFTQIAYSSTNDKILTRTKTSPNNWTSWKELISTGNILTTTGQSTNFPMTQKAVTDAINARGFEDASGVLTATSGALSNDMSSFLSSLTFAEMRSKLDVISKQSVQALDPDTATLPDLIRALQAP